MTKDVYDEQYVVNILSEQAALNNKYGSLFDDQSQIALERNKINETKCDNQSESKEQPRRELKLRSSKISTDQTPRNVQTGK